MSPRPKPHRPPRAGRSRPVQHPWYTRWAGGQRTEAFQPEGMTAAHRTLPFGTRVRVVDENSGRPSWSASTIVAPSRAGASSTARAGPRRRSGWSAGASVTCPCTRSSSGRIAVCDLARGPALISGSGRYVPASARPNEHCSRRNRANAVRAADTVSCFLSHRRDHGLDSGQGLRHGHGIAAGECRSLSRRVAPLRHNEISAV